MIDALLGEDGRKGQEVEFVTPTAEHLVEQLRPLREAMVEHFTARG